MRLNESIVEDPALEWFGELAYEVKHRLNLAPGSRIVEPDGVRIFTDCCLAPPFSILLHSFSI